MSNVYSIRNGISCSSSALERQVEASIVLRTTAVMLGVLSIIVGVFIFKGVLGFQALGPIVGWSTLSVGTVLALTGLLIKVVKQQQAHTPQVKTEEGKTEETKPTSSADVEKLILKTKVMDYSVINSSKTKMFAFISYEKMENFSEIASSLEKYQDKLFSQEDVQNSLESIAKEIAPHSSEKLPLAYMFVDQNKKCCQVQIFGEGAIGKRISESRISLILYTKAEYESRKEISTDEFFINSATILFQQGEGIVIWSWRQDNQVPFIPLRRL